MTPFQLIQWKHAILLEMKGMKHSSGRSCRKHAAVALGLLPNTKGELVVAKINEIINHGLKHS